MQRLQQMGNPLRRLAYGKVAEVPDFIPIARADDRVPAIDHLLIHLGD